MTPGNIPRLLGLVQLRQSGKVSCPGRHLRVWNLAEFPNRFQKQPEKIWENVYVGVSKNRGAPKWMVKIMENPIKMDDLGVPLFSETSMS